MVEKEMKYFLLVCVFLSANGEKRPKCGDFQVFDTCGLNACNNQTCNQRNDDIACLAVCNGRVGCRCISGYYWKDGVCVPADQCTTIGTSNPCKGKHERFAPCGATVCNNIYCPDRYTLRACPLNCNLSGGCICEAGYFRDTNGVCIPEAQCPIPTCKGPNEMFDVCGVYAYNNRTCDNKSASIEKPTGCDRYKAKCRCLDGYVRNKLGICIKESQCPVKCKKNEVFDVCGRSFCTEKECDAVDDGLVCKPNCSGEFGACRCKEGFCRNKLGNCQAICTGKNEVYDFCGKNACNDSPCDKKMYIESCDYACDPTLPECHCLSGYFRKNGVCVSAKECDEP